MGKGKEGDGMGKGRKGTGGRGGEKRKDRGLEPRVFGSAPPPSQNPKYAAVLRSAITDSNYTTKLAVETLVTV